MSHAFICDATRTPIGRFGGALAGARLVLTATHAMEARGGQRALVTMCVGVGQGLSMALERV